VLELPFGLVIGGMFAGDALLLVDVGLVIGGMFAGDALLLVDVEYILTNSGHVSANPSCSQVVQDSSACRP